MVQVWLIDKDGFYLGETTMVEKVSTGMTEIPLTKGYVKSRLVNDKWVEGATEEDIYEWKKSQQIDICHEPKPKTLEELTKENEQLWETVQFLLKKTGMIGDDEDATT